MKGGKDAGNGGGDGETVRAALDRLPRRLTNRLSARVPYSSSVALRFEVDEQIIWGVTTNLSREGLSVLSFGPRAPGTRLRITMTESDGSSRIELLARVAWCTPLGSSTGVPEPVRMGLEIVGGERAGFRSAYELARNRFADAGRG